MRIWLAPWLAGLVLLLGASTTKGAPRIVSFTGTLSTVPIELSSTFTVTSPVSGSFAFDSETPDSDPDPEVGLYVGTSDFVYEFGSYLASATIGSSGDSVIVRDQVADTFGANAVGVSGPDVDEYFPVNLTLRLTDQSGTVFASDALPTSLDLMDFSGGTAGIVFQHPSLPSQTVTATLDSISLLPEALTLIVDDEDPGFSTVGEWRDAFGIGYNDHLFNFPLEGGSASWVFTGLPPGSYNVSTTWVALAAPSAAVGQYTIFDEATALGMYAIDQQFEPLQDFAVMDDLGNTIFFEDNGDWTILSGTLTVTLVVPIGDRVRADAIRVERVPEPAGSGIALLALAAMGAGRRRRVRLAE